MLYTCTYKKTDLSLTVLLSFFFTKVKHFATQLINSLDDEDEVGVVTFGEDAEIVFPLEKITDRTRVSKWAFILFFGKC